MAHDDIGGLQGVGREPFCAEYHNAQCRLFEHECVVAPIADRDDPIRAKAPVGVGAWKEDLTTGAS